MAKYQSALTGAQMDSALATLNQFATVEGVVKSDGDGTFSAVPVDTTPTASSTNLITSGAVKEVKDTADTAVGCIASEYSSSSQYSVGTYVRYNSHLYVCNTAITTPEAWTAAHWTITSVGLELNERVPETRRVNGKELDADIGLNSDDVADETYTYNQTLGATLSFPSTGTDAIYKLTNPVYANNGRFVSDSETSATSSAIYAGYIFAPAEQRIKANVYEWYFVATSVTVSGGYIVVTGTKHYTTVSDYCSRQYVHRDTDGFYVNY